MYQDDQNTAPCFWDLAMMQTSVKEISENLDYSMSLILKDAPVMLSSASALLRFSILIATSTFDCSMDGVPIVKVIVGSPCESWSAEALPDLYCSLYNSTHLSTIR